MTSRERRKLKITVADASRQVDNAYALNGHQVLGYEKLMRMETALLNTINLCSDALRPLRKEIQKRDRRRGERRRAKRS